MLHKESPRTPNQNNKPEDTHTDMPHQNTSGCHTNICSTCTAGNTYLDTAPTQNGGTPSYLDTAPTPAADTGSYLDTAPTPAANTGSYLDTAPTPASDAGSQQNTVPSRSVQRKESLDAAFPVFITGTCVPAMCVAVLRWTDVVPAMCVVLR